MNYNELYYLAKNKGMTMASLAAQIGMTATGMKPSIENGSFPINKVVQLCKTLEITPNDLFDWDDPSVNAGVFASNISGVNTQNSNEVIHALEKVIKEKDKQITRLLSIIEKWKKP